jgi:tRNA pseudouridine(38-40) synthase
MTRVTRKLFIRIAYDGTDFHGWQRQGSLRTVQGVLEDAFRRVCRHPLALVGQRPDGRRRPCPRTGREP